LNQLFLRKVERGKRENPPNRGKGPSDTLEKWRVRQNQKQKRPESRIKVSMGENFLLLMLETTSELSIINPGLKKRAERR